MATVTVSPLSANVLIVTLDDEDSADLKRVYGIERGIGAAVVLRNILFRYFGSEYFDPDLEGRIRDAVLDAGGTWWGDTDREER